MAGRKQNKDINTNDMLVWIERYLKEYPNEKIKLAKLAKFSGIPRHYWYSRQGIKEKIEQCNKLEYEEYEISITSKNNKQLLELPDIDSIVDNNYQSKKKLKQILISYFDVIQEFYESACDKFELEKKYKSNLKKMQKLEDELQKIKGEKNKYKELSEFYKNQIRTETVRSAETAYRRENGLKDNLIELDKNKKNILAAKSEKLGEILEKLGNK